MEFTDPKTMATILTSEGFLKWAEGNPLTKRDFKLQWDYLFKEMIRTAIAAAKGEGGA